MRPRNSSSSTAQSALRAQTALHSSADPCALFSYRLHVIQADANSIVKAMPPLCVMALVGSDCALPPLVLLLCCGQCARRIAARVHLARRYMWVRYGADVPLRSLLLRLQRGSHSSPQGDLNRTPNHGFATTSPHDR